VEALLSDLRECVEEVKAATPLDSDGIRAMVAQALESPDVEAAFGQLAQAAGIGGTDLPEEMAFINEVLDALPDELANVLLINYFNDLYV
jgi:hypothetical protein